MEINGHYLRELSIKENKVSKKMEDILTELVKVAKTGDTSTIYYVIEEFDGLYEYDINLIKEQLSDKYINVESEKYWDNDDNSDVWKLYISW
ncbi:hypothetical protein M3649_03775 [Ureibacillus chungkukjangi]|uniref:hypothetical protein n=1 Tax=Ureibacillus chungkukjangi TaxID=1202712 RepID=UPI00203F3E8E|nr:hypothetical protein [Ureibacillus chungkukjangi]MCM3387250.1 hypothetical protein [Ureibacillus chungkukjangi]